MSHINVEMLLTGASGLTISNKAQKIRGLGGKNEVFVFIAESFEEIQSVIQHLENGLRIAFETATVLTIEEGGTGADSAAEARANLDVYSKAEVNALLATKAAVTHNHTNISITGTAGGGVAAHTHTGTVG